MEFKALTWSDDPAAPLVEQYVFHDPAANAVIVGTGAFRAGQRMPEKGRSSYDMREISIILEGSIETMVGDRTVILRAGDIVTIPSRSQQVSLFLEDTRLIYLFFGRRPDTPMV